MREGEVSLKPFGRLAQIVDLVGVGEPGICASACTFILKRDVCTVQVPPTGNTSQTSPTNHEDAGAALIANTHQRRDTSHNVGGAHRETDLNECSDTYTIT